jgi:hypothetical protein
VTSFIGSFTPNPPPKLCRATYLTLGCVCNLIYCVVVASDLRTDFPGLYGISMTMSEGESSSIRICFHLNLTLFVSPSFSPGYCFMVRKQASETWNNRSLLSDNVAGSWEPRRFSQLDRL